MKSLFAYPQIIFEQRGLTFRLDGEDLMSFGVENFERVMRKAVKNAYIAYRSGEPRRLHFERIRTGAVFDDHWLPPRVYTRHSIWEIEKNIEKQSFIIRYGTEKDKLRALGLISEMTIGRTYKKWSTYLGSRIPVISTFFDVAWTLGGLIKIGLNLIAAYCPKTPISRETFGDAMEVIMSEVQVTPRLMQSMGFVKNPDIQFIADRNGGHSFRLVYIAHMKQWRLLMSFFGGRIGAYVWIPGPNHEDWACADIVAPIKSKTWTFNKKTIVEPFTVRHQWFNIQEIAPSLRLYNTHSEIRTDRVKRKRKKK